MKYKFFGPANTTITTKKPHFWNGEHKILRVGRFDENGEFVANDDNKYIRKLKARFDHIPFEEIEETEEINYEELSYNELRKIYKEKNPENNLKNPTKIELIRILEGK